MQVTISNNEIENEKHNKKQYKWVYKRNGSCGNLMRVRVRLKALSVTLTRIKGGISVV